MKLASIVLSSALALSAFGAVVELPGRVEFLKKDEIECTNFIANNERVQSLDEEAQKLVSELQKLDSELQKLAQAIQVTTQEAQLQELYEKAESIQKKGQAIQKVALSKQEELTNASIDQNFYNGYIYGLSTMLSYASADLTVGEKFNTLLNNKSIVQTVSDLCKAGTVLTVEEAVIQILTK